MLTVEVEVEPGTWKRFRAECSCGGQVRRNRDYEQWSLGPGHQTQPLLMAVSYECADCGMPLTPEED